MTIRNHTPACLERQAQRHVENCNDFACDCPLLPAPAASATPTALPRRWTPHVGRMLQIGKLIEELSEVAREWGNTCVYIGGCCAWGAVALNYRDEDRKLTGLTGNWISGEKLDECPSCGRTLAQEEYDRQFCSQCNLVEAEHTLRASQLPTRTAKEIIAELASEHMPRPAHNMFAAQTIKALMDAGFKIVVGA